MKVEVIKRYNDVILKKRKKVGDTMEVSEERGKYLISQGMVKECKSKDADTQEEKPTETKAEKKSGKA